MIFKLILKDALLLACSLELPNWVKYIFPGTTMYKSSTSMTSFSKLLLTFAADFTITSLQMPVYWSIASDTKYCK